MRLYLKLIFSAAAWTKDLMWTSCYLFLLKATRALAGYFSLCRGGLVGDFVGVSTWSFITWAAVQEDHWFARTAVWHWPEASDHWPGSAGLIIYPVAYCLHCTHRISSLPVLVEPSLCLPSRVAPQKDGQDGWWCLSCSHFYISDFITHKILCVALLIIESHPVFCNFQMHMNDCNNSRWMLCSIFLWEQNMWEKKKHEQITKKSWIFCWLANI